MPDGRQALHFNARVCKTVCKRACFAATAARQLHDLDGAPGFANPYQLEACSTCSYATRLAAVYDQFCKSSMVTLESENNTQYDNKTQVTSHTHVALPAPWGSSRRCSCCTLSTRRDLSASSSSVLLSNCCCSSDSSACKALVSSARRSRGCVNINPRSAPRPTQQSLDEGQNTYVTPAGYCKAASDETLVHLKISSPAQPTPRRTNVYTRFMPTFGCHSIRGCTSTFQFTGNTHPRVTGPTHPPLNTASTSSLCKHQLPFLPAGSCHTRTASTVPMSPAALLRLNESWQPRWKEPCGLQQ